MIPLLRGAAADRRRIVAVLRRDWLVFRSYQAKLALDVVNIWYFAVSFYFIGRFVGRPDAIADLEGGYFEFVLLGSVVTTFASVGTATFSRLMEAEHDTGTLEAVLVTPAPLWTVFLGGFLLPAAMALTQTLAVVVIGLGLFGSGLDLAALAAGVPFVVLTTLAFCGLGILGAAFIVVAKRGNPFTGPVNQLTLLLSGALYPVSVLPDGIEPLSRLVPAYYAIRSLRSMVLGGTGPGDHLGDLAVLAAFALVSLPASLLVLRRALDTARSAGTLGSY